MIGDISNGHCRPCTHRQHLVRGFLPFSFPLDPLGSCLGVWSCLVVSRQLMHEASRLAGNTTFRRSATWAFVAR